DERAHVALAAPVFAVARAVDVRLQEERLPALEALAEADDAVGRALVEQLDADAERAVERLHHRPAAERPQRRGRALEALGDDRARRRDARARQQPAGLELVDRGGQRAHIVLHQRARFGERAIELELQLV